MSSLRRGVAAAVAVVAVASLLAGCGEADTGKSDYAPVSNTEYNPVDGIGLDSTYVKVRNLYALAQYGPVPPRLRMTLVNTSGTSDALIGASLGRPGVSGRLVGGTLGVLPVTPGTIRLVGSVPDAQITFRGLDAKAGTWIPVTLLFAKGRAVSGQILVQSPVSEFSDGTVPKPLVSEKPVEPVLPSGTAE